MDMDMAYFLLTEPKKEKENTDMLSPAEEAYKRLLAEKLLNNRSRILAFRNKPPEPEGIVQQLLYETLTSSQRKPARKCRHIPQVCKLICCFKHIFRIFFNIHHS